MSGRLVTLALLLAACGPGAPPPPALDALEAEGLLEAERVGLLTELEALRARQPAKEEREGFTAAEKRLEKGPTYGGAIVWSAIAPPVLQSLFRAAGADVQASVDATSEPAEPTQLRFVAKVTPPAAAFPLARRLADEQGSRPTALISRVDAEQGLVEGRFPLDPLPIPPDPPRPPTPAKVVAPATPRGPALAAELDGLRAERARLQLGADLGDAYRARVIEYDRRLALFQAVGDLRASQRVLLAAAVPLRPLAGSFAAGDLSLTLSFATPAAAAKARATLPATLIGALEGAQLTLAHAGPPPKLPPVEERAKAARAAPVPPPPLPPAAGRR